MKCKTVIDKTQEEQVLIYAHERNALVEEIEQLVSESSTELNGYNQAQIVRLNITDVYCFTVIGNKVYALTENEKLLVKLRLYKIEETLPKSFVKINQSCIANIKKIKSFDGSLSGTLTVTFKNGYKDYVSRRNMKTVKERLGL